MRFVEYPDQEMMMIDLANILAGEIDQVLMHSETASFVVPGGTTPGPIFDYLSAADLEWSRVRVLLSDERWVPESSLRSNTRLIRERLLVGRAGAATLVPLYAPVATPEEALDDLAAGIGAHLPLSVALLGMGADMHTASLFPGADNLAAALEPDAPVLLAMRAPGASEPRITLSAQVLNDTVAKHVVITGHEKRTAFENAKTIHDPAQAPISAVMTGATIHWAA